jgi:uncharacterized Zn-finger protein
MPHGREPPETIVVDRRVVACDGGDGALGHPRVYLNMGDADRVDCPYCGRRYTLAPGAGAGHAH